MAGPAWLADAGPKSRGGRPGVPSRLGSCGAAASPGCRRRQRRTPPCRGSPSPGRYGITVQFRCSRNCSGLRIGEEAFKAGSLWRRRSLGLGSAALQGVGRTRQTSGDDRLRRRRDRARTARPGFPERSLERTSGCPARNGPDTAEPDRRLLDPRRAGARARRRGLAGGAGARLSWCWRRSRTRRRSRRTSRRSRRGPTSPSCGSRPPGSRAAATPRSTRRRGAILLLADDDVTHPPGAYDGIRRAFAANPGLDLFVGRSLDPDGRPRKRPLPRRRLTRLNAARASSHEIAVRLAPVRAAGVRFDEGFGVGAGTAAPARRGVRLPRRLPGRRARGRARPPAGQRAPARELGLRLGGRGPGAGPGAGLRPGLRPRRARRAPRLRAEEPPPLRAAGATSRPSCAAEHAAGALLDGRRS